MIKSCLDLVNTLLTSIDSTQECIRKNTVNLEIFAPGNFHTLNFKHFIFIVCQRGENFMVHDWNLELMHIKSQDKCSVRSYGKEFAI